MKSAVAIVVALFSVCSIAEPIGVAFQLALVDDGQRPVVTAGIKVAGEKSLPPKQGFSFKQKLAASGLGLAAVAWGGHELDWWDLDGSSPSKRSKREAAGLPLADNRDHNENREGEQTVVVVKCENSPGCKIEVFASMIRKLKL